MYDFMYVYVVQVMVIHMYTYVCTLKNETNDRNKMNDENDSPIGAKFTNNPFIQVLR